MNIAGQDSIVFFCPVPGYDWFFGLVYDESTAFADSNQLLQRSLLATVLQLLLAVAGAPISLPAPYNRWQPWAMPLPNCPKAMAI